MHPHKKHLSGDPDWMGCQTSPDHAVYELKLNIGRWTEIGPYIKFSSVKLFLKQVQDPDIALILHAFDLACLGKWVRGKLRISDMLNLTLELATV